MITNLTQCRSEREGLFLRRNWHVITLIFTARPSSCAPLPKWRVILNLDREKQSLVGHPFTEYHPPNFAEIVNPAYASVSLIPYLIGLKVIKCFNSRGFSHNFCFCVDQAE